MAGAAIPRSIPLRAPRLAATVSVPLREGGIGSVPFPPEPIAGDARVLVCSGVDLEPSTGEKLRVLFSGHDLRDGTEQFVIGVQLGPRDTPDQVSLPTFADDGRIAQLVRRGDRISLLVADPDAQTRASAPRYAVAQGVVEIEPAMSTLARAEEAVLSRPIAGPNGTWIVSWGLRNADPRRLRTHRVECLRSEGGPPLWWADDERVLGAVEGVVVTRASGELMVAHLLGRRIGTGAPAWETDIVAGSRVEMAGDLVVAFDRSRRARERNQRYDAFTRERAERIANDPIGSRNVDWTTAGADHFRAAGRLSGGPMRGLDAKSGAVRFRGEVSGDLVGDIVGGPHLFCAVVVDEEGVGGVFRLSTSDGTEVGRRGFHVADHYYWGPAQPSEQFPELVALDHTHLLWLDARKTLVCEVLADAGNEVWRLPLDVTGIPTFAVSAGRIFVRDTQSLRIYAEESH